MADLVDKSALITGAQQGIGAAIAIAFAREGADVVINYIDDLAEAETVTAAIHATGRRAVPIPADVSRLCGRNPRHAFLTDSRIGD